MPWRETLRVGREEKGVFLIGWSTAGCKACRLSPQCVGKGGRGRVLEVSKNYPTLQAGRARQKTAEFKEKYRRRSGVEASFSGVVNTHGGRKTKYRGLGKTLGYYIAIGIAMNLRRVVAHEAGKKPRRERRSTLRKLMGAPKVSAKGWGQISARERFAKVAQGR